MIIHTVQEKAVVVMVVGGGRKVKYICKVGVQTGHEGLL